MKVNSHKTFSFYSALLIAFLSLTVGLDLRQLGIRAHRRRLRGLKIFIISN